MTSLILFALGCIAGFGTASQANAQAYPSHPITIVVPLASGGSTDVIARIMAEGMRAALGQALILENTGGAGGYGVVRASRAGPDIRQKLIDFSQHIFPRAQQMSQALAALSKGGNREVVADRQSRRHQG